MKETEVKEEVRRFYDRVGWQPAGDGQYQNARYEDLRPVSQEYIHRCHLRLNRHLKASGRYLLDAGSGPVQYPEYLRYSQGYQYRVCLDISFVALKEARHRIGAHGLYVVGDVANLPFKPGVFEGIVSLHTLHHLPANEQKWAYGELCRVLAPGSVSVVVNGWTDSPLMRRSQWLVDDMEKLGAWVARRRHAGPPAPNPSPAEPADKEENPTGTYVQKLDAAWLRSELQLPGDMNMEIRVWRSVSVRFLRAVIHQALGGRFWLRLLYGLEERFPHYFGEKGQYPLIIFRKD